jgi:hypothetical protein
MHAVEHALIADEEEAENQIICSRLDMPLASAGYSVCSANLATVRQRQRERLGRLSFGPG